MKKTKQIKLQLVRDVVRALQSQELRQVDGGGAIPVSVLDICPPPPITGDSRRECCA
jgi:hypothetical protein